IYAFFVFSGIPSVQPQPQWQQQQTIILAGLLFGVISIFVVSIILSNIMLNSEKLSQRFRSISDQLEALKLTVGQVRVGFIVMSALGETIALNGLIFYILSGDTIRPWVFFVLTVIHYSITMSKLRKIREDVGQMIR
ncbi:MAG: hypothetical protein ACPL7B_15500, partial [Candidatus Poribacteria bacterium]